MSDAVLDFQPDAQEFDFQPEAAPPLRPEDQAKIDAALRTVPLPRPAYMQTEQTLTAPIPQRPTPVSPEAQQYEADLARANQVKPTLSGVAGTAAEVLTAPTGGAVSTEPGEGTNVAQGVQELQTPGKRARGTGRLALSGLNAATPLIGPAVLEADTLPKALGQAFGFGEGYVGGKAAKKVTKAAGGGEEAQNIAEGIGQLSPVVAHAALRPEIGVRSSPEGSSVSGSVRGAGAGIAVTPEAVTVWGKVGPLEASKTFTRGAKPAEKPALTPQTIEGELAKNPATRDEIADAQAATNYAGPEQAKAAVVAKRQAAAAAVEGAATEKPPAVAAPPENKVVSARATTGEPSERGTNATAIKESAKNTGTRKEKAPETLGRIEPIGAGSRGPESHSSPKALSDTASSMAHGSTGGDGVSGHAAIDFRPDEVEVPRPSSGAVPYKGSMWEHKGGQFFKDGKVLDKSDDIADAIAALDQEDYFGGKTIDGEIAQSKAEESHPDFQPDQFKHRSTQINIPEDSEAHQALETTRDRISDSDLAAKGKDVGGNHVTVRWGLQADDDDKLEKLKQYLASVPPFEAKLGKTEKFQPSESSDGAAVIQSPVEAPEMKQIHDELAKHGDFTEPTFKDYKPHATIAYVKPEKANRYVGMSPTAGKKFTVNSIAVTDRQGKQEEVKLGGKPEPSAATKEPWQMTQLQASNKNATKTFPLAGKVEVKNGKPVYTYSTTLKWGDGERTFEIQPRGALNGFEQANRLHKKVVETALREGKPVPPEVLKDYPDLQSQPESKSEVKPVKVLPQRSDEQAAAPAKAKEDAGQKLIRLNATTYQARAMEVAERLRKSADALDKHIDERRREMTQNPTPKRMKEYRSRLHDATNLGRVQQAMRALADAHEAGNVPRELAALRSKDEIHRLVYQGTENGGYYDVIPSRERYANKSADAKKLQDLMDKKTPETSEATAAKEKASKISQLEAQVQFQKLPGYFPTPKAVASRLLDISFIEPGMKVLEPSAGKGNIAELIRQEYPEAKLDVVEQQSKLREILGLKGFNVVGEDFLQHKGEYDRIIMNPPFEKGADVEHVRHAYDLLKPGGRVIAIMSPHAEFASDKKSVDFRNWLDDHGGFSDKLPDASFKESGTGAGSRRVVIDKPERAAEIANDKKSQPRREVISTAKPEYSAQKQVKGTSGNDTQLLTSSGERPAKYRVVEAADLTPSHNSQTFARNTTYPEGVQERAYDTSKEAQARVIQQTEKFNPDYVINTNPDAVNGPPIVTPDGIVLGGNSRAMTIQRLYKAGRFMTYKQVLVKQADTFGLNKEVVRMMKEPVLVREVEAPKTLDEMRALGSELNKSMTGALGVNERAVSAGKAVSRETLNSIAGMIDSMGDNASLRDAMRDRGSDIVKLLVKDGAITERERPQFVDTATGGLSEEGKTFVERALLGSVVDDPRLMDAAPKSVLNKLDSSLAALSSLAPRTDAYNILPLIRGALREHAEIASKGIPVEDHLNQSSLFGGTRNPAVDAIVRTLAEKPTTVKTKLRQFAQDANFDVQGQGMLAIGTQPSPSDAFNAAFGTNLSDEALEDAIIQSAQSDLGAGSDSRVKNETSESSRDLQQPATGETRPSGKGTAEAGGSQEKTKLASLFSDESGEFNPSAIKSYVDENLRELRGARTLERGIFDLDSRHQARVLRAAQAIEKANEEYGGKAALPDYEQIYHYLENPDGEKLTPKQQDIFDRVVQPVMEQNQQLYEQLKDQGVPIDNYVHRVAKGKGGWFDRIVAGVKGTGKGNLLSKSAPQTKGRTMMALELETPSRQDSFFRKPGERVVVSLKGGQVTAWKNGSPENLGGISHTDEGKVFEDKDGNIWRLKQATTKEIERDTELRYYHNALASAFVSNLQLAKAVDAAEFVNSFKSSPEFSAVAFKEGNGNPPKDWRRTQLPQFNGYYFEPHYADVLDRYAQRLQQTPSALDQVGVFMRTAMLLNPIMHPLNVSASWAIDRGVTGMLPHHWVAAARSGMRAIKAVATQNEDFLQALDEGAPLQSQREKTRQITQLFFDQLGEGLRNEEPWATRVAKSVGLAPVNLIKALHDLSSRVAWLSNDVLFLQAAYERQVGGMGMKAALRDTARVIPDYRLPAHVLNSRTLSKLMENRWATIFGSYHYGLLKGFAETAKSALGLNENPVGGDQVKDIAKGWDRLALMGLVAMALYPLLDELAKKLTGNQHAHAKRVGPFAVIEAWSDALQKRKTVGEALQTSITPAPQTKAVVELATNRESYSGRHIYDPHDDWATQAQQVKRFLLGELGQIGQAQRASQSIAQRTKYLWGQVGVQFRPSRAEKIASDIASSKVGTAAAEPDEMEKYEGRHDMLDALRAGNMRPLEEAFKSGKVTRDQAFKLMQRAKRTTLQDTVYGFSYSEIMRVYDAATPEEKQQLLPLVRKKRDNLLLKGRVEEVESVQ